MFADKPPGPMTGYMTPQSVPEQPIADLLHTLGIHIKDVPVTGGTEGAEDRHNVTPFRRFKHFLAERGLTPGKYLARSRRLYDLRVQLHADKEVTAEKKANHPLLTLREAKKMVREALEKPTLYGHIDR